MSGKSSRASTRSSGRQSTSFTSARVSGRASGRVSARRGGGGGRGGKGDNKALIFGIAAVAALALGALAVAFGAGGGGKRVGSRAPRAEAPRPARRAFRNLTTRAEIEDNLAAAKRRLAAANQGGSNAARNRDREEANLLCDEVIKSAIATERDKSQAQKLKYEAKKTMTR